MTTTTTRPFWTVFMALFFLAIAATHATAALDIEGSLQDPRITTDEAATLTLKISGDGQISLEMPEVDALSFRKVGQQQSINIINGRRSASIVLTYQIIATQPGEYEIPPVIVRSGAEEAATDRFSLTVTQGSGRPHPNAPPLAPPSGFDEPTSVSAEAGELAFLEVTPAKTEAYVGELVPLEVKAYFRNDIRMELKSGLAVEGGSFTLKAQDGKPPQRRVSIGGISYTEISYYSALAATKPGSFPLEIGLEVVAMIPQKASTPQNQSGSMIDRMFGNFFGPRPVPTDLPLKADPIPLKIRALPDANKPADFSGAVGQFTITGGTSSEETAVGEPVTIDLQVQGEGNFDRVGSPKLAEPDGWKAYPSTERFVPADSIGKTGVKMFEQVIAPQDPDIDAIPAFEFTYFDPEIEDYQTVRTEPLPLVVTGSLPPPVASEAVESGPDEPSPPETDVGTITDSLGIVRPLRPLYTSTWFLAANGMSLFALAAGAVLSVRRGRREDPERIRQAGRARAMQGEREAMERAVAAGDTEAFFGAARHYLQLDLAAETGIAPESITGSDVGDPDLREIFETADSVRYSGVVMSGDELRQWRSKIESTI